MDQPWDSKQFEEWLALTGKNITKIRKEAFNKSHGIKESDNKLSYKELYIPFFDAVALRMNKNKVKYPENNYLKDMDTNLLLDAMQRHLNKIRHKYKEDTETHEEHLAAIGCNAMMILAQLQKND